MKINTVARFRASASLPPPNLQAELHDDQDVLIVAVDTHATVEALDGAKFTVFLSELHPELATTPAGRFVGHQPLRIKIENAYLFALDPTVAEPRPAWHARRQASDGEVVTVVGYAATDDFYLTTGADSGIMRVHQRELHPVGADDESSREPTADQERAWDAREDVSHGTVLLGEYLDAIEARHRG